MPGILEYLDAQVDAIQKHTAAALDAFDETGVHQARVGTRRLKAGLDLLRPLLDKSAGKPLQRAGRRLRRWLGPLRDFDVMISAVAAAKVPPKLAPACEWVGTKLDHARRDARLDDQKHGKAAAKLLGKFAGWFPLRHALEPDADAIGPVLTEALHAKFAAFAAEADFTAGLADPPADHGPLDVHAVRINGKALRYTLEMAAAHGLDVPPAVLKSFKSLQQSLGDWHDGVVLAEEAMRQVLAHELPLHDPDLAVGVLDLVKSFLAASNAALGKFKAQWKREGTKLARALKTHVPLVTPPTPTQDAETFDPDAPGPVEVGTITTGGNT